MAKSKFKVGQVVWLVADDWPDAKAKILSINKKHCSAILEILPEYITEDDAPDRLTECGLPDMFTEDEYLYRHDRNVKRVQNG